MIRYVVIKLRISQSGPISKESGIQPSQKRERLLKIADTKEKTIKIPSLFRNITTLGTSIDITKVKPIKNGKFSQGQSFDSPP